MSWSGKSVTCSTVKICRAQHEKMPGALRLSAYKTVSLYKRSADGQGQAGTKLIECSNDWLWLSINTFQVPL